MINSDRAMQLISEVRKKKAEYEQALSSFASFLSIPSDVAHWIVNIPNIASGVPADFLNLSPTQRSIVEFLQSRSGTAVSNAEICSHLKKTPKMLVPHMRNLIEKRVVLRMRRGYYALANSTNVSRSNGGAPKIQKSAQAVLEKNPTCARIYKVMDGTNVAVSELVKKTKKSAPYVYQCLTAMSKAGLLKKISRGVYARA